ncbi:MAG: nuclease-related domain-containing protein [Parcubacteria group bacterium]
MAIIYGHKSNYITSIERKNFVLWLACLVVAGFLIWSLHWLRPVSMTVLFIALAGFAVLFTIVAPIMRYYDRGFFKALDGLLGEKAVHKVLTKLPDTYSVFWGLKLREHRDIDFVVVGPTGVFTLEVKSHVGTIGLSGRELLHGGYQFKEKDVLWQAKSEAMDVHGYLLQTLQKEIFVTPVIVFSSKRAWVHFGLKPVQSVYVIQKEWLLKLLTEHGTQSNADIDRIVPVLERLMDKQMTERVKFPSPAT